MRLGIMIPDFPTQTHVFFWREIVALRSLGVEVRVLSTRRPSEPCPHEFGLEAGGDTHYVFPPSLGATARLLLSPRRLRRSIAYVLRLSGGRARLRSLGLTLCAADLVQYARQSGLDHVHVHSCADAAHIAALARLLGGPPYSLSLHGDLSVYGSHHAQKMHAVSFVAATSEVHRKQLVDQVGLLPERTCVAPMGVDTAQYRPAQSRVGREHELRLITVARLTLGKGHRFALEALRALVDRGLDVSYTIVGSGPDRAEIEADIERWGLAERVQMPGALGDNRVADELQRADVFVLPSTGVFESAPVSVMEAMSCGLPVIVSRIGGTPDMISDGVDGLLVEQEDVAGLTAAIDKLYRDPALRHRMGQAGRQRAVTSFDRVARAKILLGAIERAAGTSRVKS